MAELTITHDTRQPLLRYPGAEVNRMLRKALAKQWPKTRWRVRAGIYNRYGKFSSVVRYTWTKEYGPTLQAVRDFVAPYMGWDANNCDGWDILYQDGEHEGKPIKIHYDVYVISVQRLNAAGLDMATGRKPDND